VDLEAVFRACAESGTALEVSGVPMRLDLDGTAARRAKELGVTLSLDTDAHRTSHLSKWRTFALGQARRGWLETADVLNARPLAELRTFLKHKRPRAL
jgi:DNA polymerase (family 10)